MIGRYRFGDGDIAEDIREKYGFTGDLARLFAENDGPVVHKWHHYIPIYDRYLAPYRGTGVRFLEIGVAKGGSLQMWRRYLGPDAVLFGIDIDPACAAFDGQSGSVRIGSQDDPDFLAAVVGEMGGVDVVLDDGSHRQDHVRASLAALFPKLSAPGLYLIEDLHTAYWEDWGGGLDAPANFFRMVSEIVEDMHGWAHKRPPNHPDLAPWVSGLHVFDSLVVLEKNRVHRPVHSRAGRR